MKIAAMMLVRNEDWVLGLSARAALRWADVLVMLLHNCTDESEEIAKEIEREVGERLFWFATDEPDWKEMAFRQFMLEAAREQGAMRMAIVDADEVMALPIDMVRSAIESTPCGSILQLPGFNLRNGIHQYHANGLWSNRWFSFAFMDQPALHWAGDRFHHREPMGLNPRMYRPIDHARGGIMHLWGASERRLRAKHALYKVTERLRWPDKATCDIDAQYSLWLHPALRTRTPEAAAPWSFAKVPDAWWAPYRDWMRYLDVEREPWQEAEVRRLLAEHGAAKFAGLDLFGVA